MKIFSRICCGWIMLAALPCAPRLQSQEKTPAGLERSFAAHPARAVVLSGAPFGLAEIALPEIPEKSLSILDYGARGDGHFLNTRAIQAAISACAADGGGRVIIPAGIWLTGPVRLESRIDLHLEAGALLLFSSDHSLYPVIQAPTKGYLVASPLYGYGLEDIAITGPGIIDGAGESWRPVKKFKTTSSQWKELLQSGGVVDDKASIWWPSQAAMNGADYLEKLQASKKKKEITPGDYLPARDFLRPYMVSLIDCKRVLIEEVTIKNSPKFALCPAWCDQLIVKNVKVNNEWWAQNGDGIDISACRNVLIEDCVVTAGDDGICMKSSNRSGRPAPALENIVIRDCIVYHGHGGFVVGSNTDGGMRNILVENCTFIGTDVGLRFKSSRGRGGLVENIQIKNIFMKEIVNEAILFDSYYETDQRDTLDHAITAETPIFRAIIMENIYCVGAAQAVAMTGLPEMPIQDISLQGGAFTAEQGVGMEQVKGITLKNIALDLAKAPVFVLEQSSGISLDNISFRDDTAALMQLKGMGRGSVTIKNTDLSRARVQTQWSGAAVDGAVVVQ